MPLYFLHLHDGSLVVEDQEGQHYVDEATAVEGARSSAREMLADKIMRKDIVDGQFIVICDEENIEVSKVYFSEEIRLPGTVTLKDAAE